MVSRLNLEDRVKVDQLVLGLSNGQQRCPFGKYTQLLKIITSRKKYFIFIFITLKYLCHLSQYGLVSVVVHLLLCITSFFSKNTWPVFTDFCRFCRFCNYIVLIIILKYCTLFEESRAVVTQTLSGRRQEILEQWKKLTSSRKNLAMASNTTCYLQEENVLLKLCGER